MSNSLWHPRQSMTEPRFLCFPLLSDSSSYCLLPIVNKAVVASMVQTSLAIDHLLLLLPFLQKRPSLPSTSKQKLTFVTVFMFSYQWGHHSVVYNEKKATGIGIRRVCLQCRRPRFNPWVRKIPGEENSNPLQYSCLEKSHGWRSLVGYSPWGCKKSDMTEQLTRVNM